MLALIAESRAFLLIFFNELFMNFSVPVQAGWRLRVLTGTSRGHEFDLTINQYTLGSSSPSSIVIPHPSISGQHVCLNVRTDRVEVRAFHP
ncbi:MAG: hypothetical protein RLZZ536_756, partial [Planctomycetota bacterium]